MKLNKKGFTLVELLAVIVILVIIVSIAIPTITSTLERQKDKKVSSEQELLASAAELYFTSNAATLDYRTNSTCSIMIQDLINNNYVAEKNITNVTENGSKTCFKYDSENGTIEASDCTKTECDTNTGTKSKNALLSNLLVEGYKLSPKFNSSTTEYTLTNSLEAGTTSVKVTATKSDSKSKVTITGNDKLKEGDNTITIVVTAEDGTTTKTYKVTANVERQISSDTSLATLTVNGTDILEDKAITLTATNSIVIEATTTDSYATIISGTGTKSVTPGTTENFDIIVQSESGKIETYTITVTIEKEVIEGWYECFKFNNDTQTITGYDSACSKSVTIPDTINNKKVLAIGEEAFEYMSLTSVTLPNTVTTIEAYAFYANQISGTLTIPNSVITIEEYAFSGNNLTNIEFGTNSSLTKIGDWAFFVNNLTSINIPSSVKGYEGIGLGAFNQNNISDVYYNGVLSNSDGFIYYVRDDGTIDNTYIIGYGRYGGEVTIPEQVTNIVNSAFMKTHINSLNFASLSNLYSIETDAFSYCNLGGFSLPESLTFISGRAFYKDSYSNSELVTIVNNSKKSFDWGEIINGTSGYKFASGIVENSVGNVEVISPEKFIYEIINENDKTVQINGFVEGYSESELVIPETLNIEGVDYKVVGIGTSAFDGQGIESVDFSNNLGYIDSFAFYGNKLTSLDLKNVTYIGSGAFNDNQLPEDQAYIYSPSASFVLVSYGGAERNGSNIQIPSNITQIGDSAFYRCYIQNELKIPNGITYIGDSAFFDNNITDIDLPESITYIGDSAFFYNNISTLIISKTDSNLTIGYAAFYANNIKYVYNENGNVFQWGKILNADSNSYYFSEGIVDDIYVTNPNKYKYTDEDNAIITYNDNGNTYTCGSEGTSYGLVLPPVLNGKQIKGIANDAFRLTDREESGRYQSSGTVLDKCTSDVIIPDTVTSIGSNAFSGNGLTSINLPSSIEYIGSGAFSENNLTEVTLPDKITDGVESCDDDSYDIGDSAFINNYNLWKVNSNSNLNLEHVLHATYGDCTGCRNGSVTGYLTWWGKDSAGNGGTCIFKNYDDVCNYN